MMYFIQYLNYFNSLKVGEYIEEQKLAPQERYLRKELIQEIKVIRIL